MPVVAIRLLGGFGAAVDGTPVAHDAWRLRKARELVKLLALARGHRLHREQAMDVLWPDRGPAAASNNLYQAVHAARRVLGADSIQVRDELLSLVADVDVDGFEEAAAGARRAGTAAALQSALSLYAGELLPENRYDDWASVRRDELAGLRTALEDELAGVGPAEPLRTLPAATSSFVGRDRELADLATLLGRTRLLTLVGTGGAGKTRLALEVARRAVHAVEDGVALVELAAVSDPRYVEDAVAAALDVRALPGRPLVDAVVDFLAPRAVLVVLDNCEHVLAASAAVVATLLRAAPRVTVLATSREQLRVSGEIVFRVPSLAIPDPDEHLAPAALMRYEAVRLFVDRAAAAAPGFVLDEENADDVARICLRLDGLPLALELAAGRLGALGPASIAERLDDRFSLLRAGAGSAPTRQQTLAATLQWSHDLLEPEERVLLRRLAVFAGGFLLPAAESVCAGDGLEARRIADVLARLVEKSLVSAGDGQRERRYRLLETVRAYARARLDEAGEAPAFTLRHARWALELAETERDATSLDPEAANLRGALDTLLVRDPHGALELCVALGPFWLRRIELAEAGRYFASAFDAAAERTPLRVKALLAAASIDLRGGLLTASVRRIEEALATAVELGDRRLQWEALHFLGAAGVSDDDGEEATRQLVRALELATREGFRAAEAICVYTLGVARWVLGDLAGADELLTRSLALFAGLEDPTERVPSPTNISEAWTTGAANAPSLRLVFEETLQPFVEISAAAALGYVLANQASLARIRGELVRARLLLDASAARFADLGDERGRADVHVRRAYLELAEGSVEPAREELERSLELRRLVNDRRGIGLVLTGLSLVELAAGDHERAELHVAESCDIFRRAGDRWGLVSALWRAADVAFDRDGVVAAEAALEEALAVVSKTGRDRWIAQTLAGLGEAAARGGDKERAALLFADARALFVAKGDADGTAVVEGRLRELAHALQRPRKGGPGTTSSTTTTKRRQR
jgi:predicted ATPase